MAPEVKRLETDYAVRPGETLYETIDALGMTQAELARRMGRPIKTVNEIIKGKATITADTALQLERVLGVPARFWLALEANYREDLARLDERQTLDPSAAAWLLAIPYREMDQYGWVDISRCTSDADTLGVVLKYFGVASVAAWNETWTSPHATFRKSSLFDAAPGAVAAWLRQGEVVGQSISCSPFSVKKFRKAIEQARALTTEPPDVFVPAIQGFCAQTGVAVAFVREMPKCPASGATQWLSSTKALIQLSLRYKSDDHLWFTFFHEAGHVLLHGKRLGFLEGQETTSAEQPEQEANYFAEDMLIPRRQWEEFVTSGTLSAVSIGAFAHRLGIAPGLVVGRLQHEKLVPYRSRLNALKRRFSWGL